MSRQVRRTTRPNVLVRIRCPFSVRFRPSKKELGLNPFAAKLASTLCTSAELVADHSASSHGRGSRRSCGDITAECPKSVACVESMMNAAILASILTDDGPVRRSSGESVGLPGSPRTQEGQTRRARPERSRSCTDRHCAGDSRAHNDAGQRCWIASPVYKTRFSPAMACRCPSMDPALVRWTL